MLEYDSFGHLIRDSNPAFVLHIGFAGGLADPVTDLVRFGFRDYDAVAGKWTAKDPIGFAGQDSNLYRYVGNNVMNYADPLGLYPKWLVNVASALVNPLANLISGGAPMCGIGPDRDATTVMPGKCPTPQNAQDLACILHDFRLTSELDKKFWQVWDADVSQAHWDLAKDSPSLGMKIVFALLSLPGLPFRWFRH